MESGWCSGNIPAAAATIKFTFLVSPISLHIFFFFCLKCQLFLEWPTNVSDSSHNKWRSVTTLSRQFFASWGLPNSIFLGIGLQSQPFCSHLSVSPATSDSMFHEVPQEHISWDISDNTPG
jgi:hypothetical protein